MLLEYTYNDIARKQLSVNRLFPKFPDRVRQVAAHGGVRFKEMFPETWHFTVASGTKDNVKYDVYVKFKNIYETLKKFVPDKRLWKKDGSGVDLRKLAQEVLNNVDMETSCSCPASLYWGPDYIRTQRKAQYGDQEDRRPSVRNPREYGSLCKHGDLVWEVLPAYTMTFATHLKRFYEKSIKELEVVAQKTTAGMQKAATELGKKQKEPIGYARGGEPVFKEEPPKKEEKPPEAPKAPPVAPKTPAPVTPKVPPVAPKPPKKKA
jgi:hypothetical protein